MTYPYRIPFVAVLFLIVFFVGTGIAQAQRGDSTSSNGGGDSTSQNTSGSSDGQTLINPLKVNSLEGLLGLIVAAAVDIGTIVLVLALVWVGFLFVKARGNAEELSTARKAFFWTVIGGLILLGATGLSAVIQSTATSLGT